ncbi:hypothetical protein OOT46_13280 [Aquabacterium sp. A7-Y]|uniref:hypothetical protein n=1 Tax=Aquabacterium sp. A7-Y TaxID=1349605 RepID=UPI00223DD650|nr:hypothetical protein [Aquabacterium sp. A7-Y]MCW7538814.1 hypothetical protein [Aquabacterium sp. A7-Y]
MKHALSAVLFGSLSLVATSAMADGWPGSVVGNWNVLGNQSAGVLSITSQAAGGLCRRIVGTIYGNPIEGFYCPFSGRISFIRKNGANNDTSQSWVGNVSQAAAVLRMGGTFAAVAPAGGSPGEYNFQATK